MLGALNPNMPLSQARVFAVILGLLTFQADAAVGNAGVIPALRAEELDAIVAKYAEKGGPGCAVGVLQNGRAVYRSAAGTADGNNPLTPATPFNLASVSKQFTAASVYLLADQGKIRLQDPVRRRIPELPSAADRITIQHLLNHTSGLRDYSALQEVMGTTGNPLDDREVISLMAGQRELNFEPGSDYEYSNSEYVLLSIVVERVSGMSLGAFAGKYIFEPLGMLHSEFQSDRSNRSQWATGYQPTRNGLQASSQLPRTTGDGGLYSSVGDMLRWLDNFDHPTAGTKKVINRLQRRARLNSGERLPHTSGLFWGEYKGLRTISHDGAVAGFQADVVRFPKQRLAVVCLCNRGDVDAIALSRQIAGSYLQNEFTQSPQTKSTTGPGKARPSEVAGVWESRQGWILSTSVSGDGVALSLGGASYTMLPVDAREFSTQGDGPRLLLRSVSRDRLSLRWEGDRENVFQRLRDAMPSPVDLDRYTGEFENRDTGASWRMVVADGKLTITTAAGWRIPLEPIGLHRFVVGPWVVQFAPDDNGAVGALRLHRERLWNLRFTKSRD